MRATLTPSPIVKDLKGLQQKRGSKGVSSSQCTDLVMKVCSDNLFVHHGDSTPLVVILQSTSARVIDKLIGDDLAIMQKENERVFFRNFDL